MSASPLGTVPVTSMVLKPASRKPAVNQTTCFAGPPTFNRAIILITFGFILLNLRNLCNLWTRTVLLFVGAGFSHKIRGAQETLKRPRVGPPAFELVPCHRIAFDVSVVDVCDFELAAAGRLKIPNDVVDRLVVHVNADDC